MSQNTPGDTDSKQDLYRDVESVLRTQFSYEMTPAEAVDYIAVEKADVATGKWAAARDVDHSTVSGNVGRAKERINTDRLDARVNPADERIVVTVTSPDGTEHELPFDKETEVMGTNSHAELTHVYEATNAVHGHYLSPDGSAFESTLWYDGRITSSFEEFDFAGEFGSPQAKADAILWSQDQSDGI